MSINGLAILIFGGATLITGVVCYAWGYWDGMETERKAGRRSWTIYGRVPGAAKKATSGDGGERPALI